MNCSDVYIYVSEKIVSILSCYSAVAHSKN